MSESDEVRRAASDLRRTTENLADLNLRLRRQLEVAELSIPRLNDMLDQLYAVGMTGQTTIVGRVIHQRPYLPGLGPEDSGQVFQAALSLPGGLGVLVLDSEEYLEHQQNASKAIQEQPQRFLPFAECESALKAMLLPEAHKLLGRLLANLSLAGS